jgi:acyl-coenzyme A synthetase/AMP-(fatty) acid ligase
MSIVKSKLTVPVPNIDLVSYILDKIPDHGVPCHELLFSGPSLLSAEDPEGQNLSLIEFKHLVLCFASALKQAGLLPGDHVILVSPNYIHCLVICLGVIALGGIFCTSQPDFKIREYTDQFRRDEPKWLLVADEEPLRGNASAAWKACGGASNRI